MDKKLVKDKKMDITEHTVQELQKELEAARTELGKLKTDLAEKNESMVEITHKAEELEHNWKRALADYKNLEKRIFEEREMATEFANSVLVEKILPVLDNFELLEKHTQDMGLILSLKELSQILENAGLKAINVKVGDDFDPKTMNALDVENGEKNKITNVAYKGYLFKSKLIRPTSVKVGNGQTPEQHKEENKNI